MRYNFAALTLLLAAPVAAAPVTPNWSVMPASSRLGFAASMSGQAFSGSFARWIARIRFDPADLAKSAVVVVIDTASARTGDATRDESLPTDDWFAARAFPQASFRSTTIRALGGGRYVANGFLKIRDAERPVALTFTLSIAGDTATMRGSTVIDRRQFGVGRGQFSGGDTVATAVRIDVVLLARKQK
jgi:polyisoprenoid-binding protein YceI